MKNLNVIFRKLFLIILPLAILASCKSNQDTEQKSGVAKDSSVLEIYKQFDSTVTIEKLDSLKTKLDSLNKWRDSKRKRSPF